MKESYKILKETPWFKQGVVVTHETETDAVKLANADPYFIHKISIIDEERNITDEVALNFVKDLIAKYIEGDNVVMSQWLALVNETTSEELDFMPSKQERYYYVTDNGGVGAEVCMEKSFAPYGTASLRRTAGNTFTNKELAKQVADILPYALMSIKALAVAGRSNSEITNEIELMTRALSSPTYAKRVRLMFEKYAEAKAKMRAVAV